MRVAKVASGCIRTSVGSLLVAAAIVAGCGSSGGGGATAAADGFAGAWMFSSGQIAPNCSGVAVSNFDLTGAAVTIEKVDATHVSVVVNTPELQCNVSFAVSGATATASPGQTCMATFDNQMATVAIDKWTLTAASGTLVSSMAGSATVVIVSCAPTSTGTLVHASPDGSTGQ